MTYIGALTSYLDSGIIWLAERLWAIGIGAVCAQAVTARSVVPKGVMSDSCKKIQHKPHTQIQKEQRTHVYTQQSN